jgi:hypothetical protein
VDPQLITPVLLSVLVAWAIYRRFRRNIGRQAVNIRRLQLRIGIFLVIGALILIVAVRDITLLGAVLGGLAGGAALGHFGLRHTVFEAAGAAERFYTPHTYIGLFVSALFLARVAFRVFAVHMNSDTGAFSNQNPFAAYQRSPLTLAILGVLIGYYVLFYVGVIRRSRDLVIADAGKSQP